MRRAKHESVAMKSAELEPAAAAGMYVQDAEFNTEEYDRIYENEFKSAKNDPLSMFSIDVDEAS